MSEKPFQAVTFEWLSQTGDAIEGTENRSFGEPGWVDYPMPLEVGKGGYESFELAIGMTLVRSTIDFSPLVLGRLVPMMAVDAQFKEPSFQVMALRGLHGSVQETYPPANLTISTGVDLFRYTEHYISNFSADGTFSGEVSHFSVGRSVLNQLIGDDVAESLLTELNVAHVPSITVRPIPIPISQLMFNALTPTLIGATRLLFSQAKLLEYLAELVRHVCGGPEGTPEPNQQSRKRVRALHAQLVASEGRLPTLDALAQEYSRSAKLLNDEFKQEFGQSIYAFMVDYRLIQAHAALKHSGITIKQLAAKVGYSHVNNFTAAFTRKFGYPPGSLRRGPNSI
jgi:AraC-like DNA-binding protein